MPDHVPGEGWTINKMEILREKIRTCEVIIPADKKGIVAAPLIDTVPVDHIIFSLLHAQIGVGNKLLSSFLEWVDYRVENLPNDVIDARNQYVLAVVEHQKSVDNRNEWLGENGARLAGLRTERKAINDRGKEKDVNDKYVLPLNERKELIIQSKMLT